MVEMLVECALKTKNKKLTKVPPVTPNELPPGYDSPGFSNDNAKDLD